MKSTTTIIDSEAVQDGNGTESGTYDPTDENWGRKRVLYVEGDANATDVTIEVAVEPRDPASTPEFYPLPSETVTNADLTDDENNRRAIALDDDRGVGRLRVSITNNAADGSGDTVVTVKVDEYDAVEVTDY